MATKQAPFNVNDSVSIKHSGLRATVTGTTETHTDVRFSDGTTGTFVHSYLRANRKQTPKQAAFYFFLKNAGVSYNPTTETKQQGAARGARGLAKAERDAAALGYTFEWDYDPDGCSGCECGNDDCACFSGESHETLYCLCRDENGNVTSSLSSICEPSREYRRVVEAELAQEALASRKG